MVFVHDSQQLNYDNIYSRGHHITVFLGGLSLGGQTLK